MGLNETACVHRTLSVGSFNFVTSFNERTWTRESQPGKTSTRENQKNLNQRESLNYKQHMARIVDDTMRWSQAIGACKSGNLIVVFAKIRLESRDCDRLQCVGGYPFNIPDVPNILYPVLAGVCSVHPISDRCLLVIRPICSESNKISNRFNFQRNELKSSIQMVSGWPFTVQFSNSLD